MWFTRSLNPQAALMQGKTRFVQWSNSSALCCLYGEVIRLLADLLRASDDVGTQAGGTDVTPGVGN